MFALFAATIGLCRPAAGECDVPDFCTGASKECPIDKKAPAGMACGTKGLALEYCVIQDVCDGEGACSDLGYEPAEYSFKCGTANFLCGDEVT